jgi:hypothetical protein
MIVKRSSDGLARVPNASGRSWTIGYLGKNAGAAIPAAPDALFPDAYIIEQKPLSSGGPHFHLQDEFQIVMSGAGAIGKHAVRAFSVHYAGAYTPYGPIDAGAEGIAYLTLRTRYDPGAQMMPENREALRAGKRKPRVLFSEPLELGRTEDVFGPEPDGLAAFHFHVAANGTATGPDPALGGGQFWVVLDGDLRSPDGTTLPPRSCIFVSADEPVQRVQATPATPLDVLVVQFPRPVNAEQPA